MSDPALPHIKLREIAHARTGDKGNTSNIALIAYEARHYAHLCMHVTEARVKAHFEEVVHGSVVRYEMPKIGALNFVLQHALGGGVTRSLALDAHGKSLSSALLDLEIPAPPASNSSPNNPTNNPQETHP